VHQWCAAALLRAVLTYVEALSDRVVSYRIAIFCVISYRIVSCLLWLYRAITKCFHEKVGGRFGFGVYTGASSATVGFHDVLGAAGLVSERVACADAGDAVCASVLLVYLPCRVDRITRLSRVVKTIKGQSEQKAEYLICKQKVGK